MALKKTAREYLIETIKGLIQTKAIEDVTVAEILNISGVSRTTFYKHFADKQALAEQVFIDELSNLFFYDVERPLYDREVDILRQIDGNRQFYRNALKSQEFVNTWMDKAFDSNDFYVHTKLAGLDIPEPVLKMLAFHMSQTYARATMDWILDDHGMTAEEYARVLLIYLWQGLGGFVRDAGQPPVEGAVG